MFDTTKPVLVTGAAGYMASWVVEQLLQLGRTVRGTVRDLSDTTKIGHLTELAGKTPGTLELYEADLLIPGSFNKAMQGVEIVIHIASPYVLGRIKDAESRLIRPAVEGTRNVLESVNNTQSVRRVVLTSSIVAMFGDACEVSGREDQTLQETHWNESSSLTHNPYSYSKTLAEKVAWETVRQQDRWDLVTIHPGAMFGPSLSNRTDATSVDMLIQFLNGSYRQGVPRLWLGVVDVRDVARAHIKSALLPEASGRYIVVDESLSLLQISRLMDVTRHGLTDRLPRSEVPKFLLWLIAPWIGFDRKYITDTVGFPILFNNKRSREELGIAYLPAAETLDHHIGQVVNDGLVGLA